MVGYRRGSNPFYDLIYQQINSDELEGVIRNPSALLLAVGRACSGSCQTLAIQTKETSLEKISRQTSESFGLSSPVK